MSHFSPFGPRGYSGAGADPFNDRDADGDQLYKQGLWVPRDDGSAVRVRIADEITAYDAVRLLRKIANWIEEGGDPVFGSFNQPPF